MIKKLGPYLKGYRTSAIFCILCIIFESVFEMMIPFAMTKIIDIALPAKDMDYILAIGGRMVVMALAALVLGLMAAIFSANAGTGFAASIRQGLYDKIQDFSFNNIDNYSKASLVTRSTTDINNIQNSFIMANRFLFKCPTLIIMSAIMTYLTNPSLVWIFAVVAPILLVFFVVIVMNARLRYQKMLYKIDNLNQSVQENITGIGVVKTFVREKFESFKFKKSNDELSESFLRAQNIIIFSLPLSQLSIYICIIGIIYFGGFQVIGGFMESGKLLMFITYGVQIMAAIYLLYFVLVQFIISKASGERIIEVLDEKIDMIDKPKFTTSLKDSSIDFKNASFKYHKDDEGYALKQINLSIKPGENIGIIGSTGSSKSSLVQLIPRLYDLTEGDIFVGGHSVKDYSLSQLRNEIGIVLQQNVLFSGTIEENLRWGNKDATMDEIIAACEIAFIHSFIEKLPDGYQTLLDQGGVNLSGGQKQRICIARALLKNPKIIIFDDSTSAVDTATDLSIRNALKENLSDATVITIAHRVSSIEDSDRIVVMDNATINAIGTHDELMESNDIYKDFYRSQLRGV